MVVVGVVALSSAYKLLQSQQRVATAQNAQLVNQQTVRDGIDVIFGELREVSAEGGDILTIGPNSIEVRALRRLGVICGVDYAAGPSLTVQRVGDWFESGDSVFVFADNDTAIATDDEWLMGSIGSVDTTSSCGAADAQTVLVPDLAASMAVDSVRVGGVIRSFRSVEYSLGKYGSDWYLGQETGGTGFAPLVGPLDSQSAGGLVFEYFDATGATTAVPANVRRIDVTLRRHSLVSGSAGGYVADSLTTSIYTRN